MARLRIEVVSGASAGQVIEPQADVVRIGRATSNDLVLAEPHVSGEHARIVVGGEHTTLTDLGSTNGTALLRAGNRIEFDDGRRETALESGDVIELGGPGEGGTSLSVQLGADPEPGHVIQVRPIAELVQKSAPAAAGAALRALLEVEQAVGAATDLEGVLIAVSDGALMLVPRATHVTLMLREDDDEATGPPSAAGYVPVLTRIRGPGGRGTAPPGPVAITRSVFRKVVRERAAVLAADAPSETFISESLLGTGIRSTIGVPLWKGQDIVGVLQVDNRDAPGMFDAADVDSLGVLAASASLAVANARLIQKLIGAEERLDRENRFLKGRERERRSGDVEIIGQSRAMQALFAQLDKVTDTRVTVLVEGETGTGKELIASAVHFRSRRRDKLFVAQNCAALPENLLESELFGHKRGAFTGATDEKKGLFEIADGGTLFLDEVTEMPATLQAKLLRVLQEGEVRPIGSTTTRHVNVRIVAASNRNMDAEVAAGRFREDLYYRLKVFPLTVPPLRERRDDIPLLAAHFFTRYKKEIGKVVAGVAQDAMELLSAYDWPGNVRELENEIQRLVIQVDDGEFVTADMLSPRVRKVEGLVQKAAVAKGTLREMVEQVERWFLIEALRDHGGNKTNAAKTLGITREGLHKKLRALKIG